ncbi:MAG: hypothetical protein CMM07_26695 [Rhodopirellula sp.]|nr:hypothetical protein [Rhodopirellula sp.]
MSTPGHLIVGMRIKTENKNCSRICFKDFTKACDHIPQFRYLKYLNYQNSTEASEPLREYERHTGQEPNSTSNA